MIFVVRNHITNINDEFDSAKISNAQELATAKLIENQRLYLEQEKKRFHFAKVITNDNGEVWLDGNLETDPEEGNYHVFSHRIGTYDAFTTLTQVKQDIALKQQAFLQELGLQKVHKLVQPKTTGLKKA